MSYSARISALTNISLMPAATHFELWNSLPSCKARTSRSRRPPSIALGQPDRLRITWKPILQSCSTTIDCLSADWLRADVEPLARKLLQLNLSTTQNFTSQNTTILLTGATVFLGMHVLKELLLLTDARIVCLLRGSKRTASLDRCSPASIQPGLRSRSRTGRESKSVTLICRRNLSDCLPKSSHSWHKKSVILSTAPLTLARSPIISRSEPSCGREPLPSSAFDPGSAKTSDDCFDSFCLREH